ncbi:hypothetical protein BKA82DRAFT_996167 [Pisolithus tinctorius]|uniref:Uncharacterized protein n=1 Tax=Pisolithus tinctorius Marx 270 TaxID=870435 RepID=A0A0C3KIG3_PISTI|nr:hypothetical protein BKA82DRAFT_996167 [Pisolithus tinctorius]KIO09347.1 hypothetical protein M404DRAFT_996167 [Pisolithus tinctorius Marx 270]
MLLCIPCDWVVRLARFLFFCTLIGIPYHLPVFCVDPPSRCRSGNSPLPTFEDLRSYFTPFSAIPLAFWAVCSPRLSLPGDTFVIQFRASIVVICLFLYSEGGKATLGIALDWVVEMAWFLFLVYVFGFPTIYHSLVLVPPAVVT